MAVVSTGMLGIVSISKRIRLALSSTILLLLKDSDYMQQHME